MTKILWIKTNFFLTETYFFTLMKDLGAYWCITYTGMGFRGTQGGEKNLYKWL